MFALAHNLLNWYTIEKVEYKMLLQTFPRKLWTLMQYLYRGVESQSALASIVEEETLGQPTSKPSYQRFF